MDNKTKQFKSKVLIPCPSCGVERLIYKTKEITLCPKCGNQKRRLQIPNGIRGFDLGRKTKEILLKDKCPKCGKELYREKEYVGKLCGVCAHREKRTKYTCENNGRWKGGLSYSQKYIVRILPVDSQFISMACKNSRRVFEHRLVMAQVLGRPLEKWEIVHHRNGIRTDNRIENLELLPNKATNNAYRALSEQIKGLSNQVSNMAQAIRLLLFVIQNNHHANTEPKGIDCPLCVETNVHRIQDNLDGDIVRTSLKNGGVN